MKKLAKTIFRSAGIKILKKADTYIIPTISLENNAKGQFNFTLPDFMNVSISSNFSYLNSLKIPDLIENNYFSNYCLNKIVMDVSPDSHEFLQFLLKLEKIGIVYLNVTNNDYRTLSDLIEQESKFPNIIISVEDKSLSENDLLQIYDEINHPIYIGLNTANSNNFVETELETKMRRFLREMFKFSSQVKVIEFDGLGLNRMCEMSKVKTPEKGQRKHSSLKTVIDFCLISEFKGFWDFSMNDFLTEEGGKKMSENLKLVRQFLDEKGFKTLTVDSQELFQIVHNLQPNKKGLVYNE